MRHTAIIRGMLSSVYADERLSGAPYAWVEHGECMGCGKRKRVLVTDSTGDQEYGIVQICKVCINKMFKTPL